MKPNKILSLVLLVALFAFTGCKKQDELKIELTPSPSPTPYINVSTDDVIGTWKFSSVSVEYSISVGDDAKQTIIANLSEQYGQKSETELFDLVSSSITEIHKDDRYVFNSDGKGTANDQAIYWSFEEPNVNITDGGSLKYSFLVNGESLYYAEDNGELLITVLYVKE